MIYSIYILWSFMLSPWTVSQFVEPVCKRPGASRSERGEVWRQLSGAWPQLPRRAGHQGGEERRIEKPYDSPYIHVMAIKNKFLNSKPGFRSPFCFCMDGIPSMLNLLLVQTAGHNQGQGWQASGSRGPELLSYATDLKRPQGLLNAGPHLAEALPWPKAHPPGLRDVGRPGILAPT